MRKKILIGLAVFLVIIVAALLYMNNRNRTLSPPGNVSLTSGDLSVSLDYSRPSVRGRLIFGSQADGALQPFGTYWRLGANEPTRLTVNKDFTFGGTQVVAGTYDMYAVPGAESFKLALNQGNRFWGYSEPDYDEDIASISVPVNRLDSIVEQYTIELKESDGAILVTFLWSDYAWELLISE